jgi:hypothetical protein
MIVSNKVVKVSVCSYCNNNPLKDCYYCDTPGPLLNLFTGEFVIPDIVRIFEKEKTETLRRPRRSRRSKRSKAKKTVKTETTATIEIPAKVETIAEIKTTANTATTAATTVIFASTFRYCNRTERYYRDFCYHCNFGGFDNSHIASTYGEYADHCKLFGLCADIDQRGLYHDFCYKCQGEYRCICFD